MTAPFVSEVPDFLRPESRVVFCGINPGHWSARAKAPFANPRNDFWRLLHAAGFTPRELAPEEQELLLDFGYGLTNAARRTTRGSSERSIGCATMCPAAAPGSWRSSGRRRPEGR